MTVSNALDNPTRTRVLEGVSTIGCVADTVVRSSAAALEPSAVRERLGLN